MTLIILGKTFEQEMYDYYQSLTNTQMNDADFTYLLTLYEVNQIYSHFFLEIKDRINTFA